MVASGASWWGSVVVGVSAVKWPLAGGQQFGSDLPCRRGADGLGGVVSDARRDRASAHPSDAPGPVAVDCCREGHRRPFYARQADEARPSRSPSWSTWLATVPSCRRGDCIGRGIAACSIRAPPVQTIRRCVCSARTLSFQASIPYVRLSPIATLPRLPLECVPEAARGGVDSTCGRSTGAAHPVRSAADRTRNRTRPH